ncbi:MAG: branched-chain amino acid ABC transporter permease [Alphaproteobacteria bacterium]
MTPQMSETVDMPARTAAGGGREVRARLAAAALGLLLLLAPLVLGSYWTYLLTLTGVFTLVALGLNLLTGYCGQISLGHAAFFGVGAYATGLLTEKAGVPFILSLLLGALFTTGLGAIAALPALRLRSLYLAIATLGFGVVLQKVLFEWRGLTGGGGGLQLAPLRVWGVAVSGAGLFYLVLALAGFGAWGAWNVSRGRTGRALLMLRSSEIAAGSLGISSARYKVVAFGLSAFYTAVAGGLFAYLVGYINPESFNVGLSIAFLSMVVIGGLGTIPGSIVGALFYVLVPELLRGFKDAPGLVFGLCLVLVMVFLPEGLWGLLRRLGRRA